MPVGVPSGSALPLQETRRYSRTILVSHLRAVDPFTVTSFGMLAHSSCVGAVDRPAGRGWGAMGAAVAGAAVAGAAVVAACAAVGACVAAGAVVLALSPPSSPLPQA